MSMRHKEALLVATIALLGLTATLARTERMTPADPYYAKPWDQHKYLFMATHNPLDFHIAPFGWRFLNPLLVKALPFDAATGFAVTCFVGLWLTAIMLYFLLRRMEMSAWMALTGMLFFLTLGWATKVNLYDFWLTDPLVFLFCVSAIWSILAGKQFLFAALLAVGAMTKESVIFVAPLYYTLNTRTPVDTRLLRRTLLLVAPAVLILVLIRLAITPLNGDAAYLATLPEGARDPNPYTLTWLLANIGWPRIRESLAGNPPPFGIGTFGVTLVFLPLFAIRRNLSLLLRFLPFVLLAFSSVLFATNTSRLIVLAFPAIIAMAVYGIRSICASTGCDERLFVGLPLAIFAIQLVVNTGYTASPLPEALLALTYLALVLQWREWGVPRLFHGML